MAKMGRPEKPIDWKEVEKLFYIHCTQEEIAAFYDCSIDHLNKMCKEEHGITFSELSKQKREVGKMSLRRAQYSKAVNEKNTTMLIWLGKQWLGQTDKQEVTTKDETNGKVTDLMDKLISDGIIVKKK